MRNFSRISFCACQISISADSQTLPVKGQNTDFSKAGFSKCRMSNTVWEQVCFREANFFKTVLKDQDFTKSSIEGIVLSDERGELEGAVVNTFQALGLAKRLGLVIQDSGENF